ncbi:uncharacterized protein I206_102835 [Kwoniella pini CBS 10737]|uniref:Uncharacterized protein n=1 Tax=Kwoniella pini CBS 10737 TaxID=1296096 RepID=A0A1B9I6H2_9TREE|nr:uncharacterized protein I206_03188 [Kwoniella pini CBS 10737]OCF51122.1 hypothetical protein I206_03188 [Kwoniella pini CBS 10737]
MPTLDPSDLVPLFTESPSSASVRAYLESLASPSSLPEPEIKSYSDVIYHNHYSIGISLSYNPLKGLDSIDIFNSSLINSSSPTTTKRIKQELIPNYSNSPEIIINFLNDKIELPPKKKGENSIFINRSINFKIKNNSNGREFISHLGEPNRKGSGSWIGLWLEWNNILIKSEKEGKEFKIGIMIELKDPGSYEFLTEEGRKKGMGGIWERASRWEWSNIKFFKVEQ